MNDRTLRQRYKEFSPSGFVRKKNTYARVVGDVYQSFSFVTKYDSTRLTVEFGVLPLCRRISTIDLGYYDLSYFELNTYENGGWVLRRLKETIDDHSDDLINSINQRLLPFFDYATNCKKAFSALIKLETMFEQNRLLILEHRKEMDCAKPFEERILSIDKKYMALKNGDYSFAKRVMENELSTVLKTHAEYQSRLEHARSLNEKTRITKMLTRCNSRKSDLLQWIGWVNENDKTTIDQILLENEIFSIKHLKSEGILNQD